MKNIQGQSPIALCIPVLGILALGACTSTTMVDEAVRAGPASTEFNRNLQEEYVAMATSERSQGDGSSAQHFAAKALEASSGTAVGPDDVVARNAARPYKVSGNAEKELTTARSKLVTTLNDPVAAKNPAVAAKAQTSFDCWLEQQQEGWQHDAIAACRKQFETAMASLESAKMAAVPAASAAKAPVERVVYFKFDSDELIPRSQSEMAELVREAKLAKPKAVQIISYTDLSGPKEYNAKLAAMRGQSIEEQLRNAGPEVIQVDARGAVDPVVNTSEPNQENRRAIIIMN